MPPRSAGPAPAEGSAVEGKGPGVGQQADEEKEKKEERRNFLVVASLVAAFIVDNGSGLSMLVLLSWCFRCIPFVCRQGSAVWQHGRHGPGLQSHVVVSGSGICKTGFATLPRAVFLFVVVKPKMLDIMAFTDQKISYVLLMWKVGFTGYYAPRAVFPSLSSGRDARHHGRFGPEGQLPRGVQKTRFYLEIFLCFRMQGNAWTSCYMYASAYGCFWEEFLTFS